MLPTEIQRIVLLIGLAVAGYLMILAWNDDYLQTPKGVQTTQEPVPQQMPEAPVGVGAEQPAVVGLPQAADSKSRGSDVPDDSLLVPQAVPSQAPAAEPETANRLIRVTTPTMKVWIDTLGGDVVRVQLPKFPVDIDQPEIPITLLDNGNGHTYIAQSGLIGPDGPDAQGQRPSYTASRSDYELTGEMEELEVVLRTEHAGRGVTKIFQFRPNDYLVDLNYRIENTTSMPLSAGLFAQIKRDDKEPPGANGFSLGPQPYLGAALTTAESRYEKLEFDDMDEQEYRITVQGGWIAFLQHYFLSAWVADPEDSNTYYGRPRNSTYQVGYVGPVKTVSPGATGQWHSRLYVGPKDQDRLAAIATNLNLTVDYGFLWWLAVPLFQALKFFQGLVGNWGFAIILLTVAVKILLYPLFNTSFKSMAKMRKVAPKMKRLQERHADDRQKLQQEMMALYKKEQVNPLGGCIPMLLPMPIFLALYWVLYESVELRHAPFILWIQDMAAMDPFFVLPLLMGASMFLQQQLSPVMGDPMQQKMMKLMPIMFTVLFLFFPAGLVLYWLVNNVLGIAQQWFVIRQTENADAKAA